MSYKRYIGVFILLVFLIVSLQAAAAGDNTTATSTDSVKTFSQLKEEIDLANESGTLELEGTYESDLEYGLSFNKSLTIDGQGKTVLDGKNKPGIVVYSNNVTFKNLMFRNSDTAIALMGINYRIDNCTFINNFADEGAAIYRGSFYGDTDTVRELNSAGACEITNCAFISNHAVRDGGAIKYNGKDFTLTNCHFENNTALSDYGSGIGGAVYYAGNNSLIANCIFTNNRAIDGGALYLSDPLRSKKADEIINCSFFKNAADFGGAIYFSRTNNGAVRNCIFDSNIERVTGNYPDYKIRALEIDQGKNLIFNGNFWGYNIEDGDYVNAYAAPTSWVNVNLKPLGNNQYEIFFESDKGARVTDLPDCNFTIKSRTDNSLIAKVSLTNGKTVFNCTKSININNVNILNLGNGLVNKIKTKTTLSPLSTTYNSNQVFTIKLLDVNNKPISGIKFTIKVYTADTFIRYHATTNSKGITTFKPKTMSIATHKFELTAPSTKYYIGKTVKSVKVTKAKTTVKAPKVTFKFKKSKYFKATVKHKASKKAVSGIVVNLKIGKKTYKVKTDKYGTAKFNTKNLKVGKHSVRITSANSKYVISAKSLITIRR